MGVPILPNPTKPIFMAKAFPSENPVEGLDAEDADKGAFIFGGWVSEALK
jgi:hypothetical protein